MNTQNIIVDRYNNKPEIFTPIYEYRGYTIYIGDIPQWKKDINYVDHNHNSVNDKKPIFASTIRKNKCVNNGSQCINISSFGGNDGLENEYTQENWNYTKKQIDSHINQQREHKLKRINILKNSIFRTYICNNVTIRVFLEKSPYNQYETQTTIYVNERTLRNAYLKPNFVFNDVLQQVYYNTISKYNSADFKDANNKKTYFKTISTEKIDLDILPIYEFLGMNLKYNNIIFTPINVRQGYNNDFIFECYKDDNITIDTDNIKDIEIIGENDNTMCQFVALKNKLNFIE